MSNSKRTRERRSRRKHMTKHQRGIMAEQHFGDEKGRNKPPQADREKSLAEMLGLIKE